MSAAIEQMVCGEVGCSAYAKAFARGEHQCPCDDVRTEFARLHAEADRLAADLVQARRERDASAKSQEFWRERYSEQCALYHDAASERNAARSALALSESEGRAQFARMEALIQSGKAEAARLRAVLRPLVEAISDNEWSGVDLDDLLAAEAAIGISRDDAPTQPPPQAEQPAAVRIQRATDAVGTITGEGPSVPPRSKS